MILDFYKYLPEYYNNESRDFQLFTRVFDLIENSLKFDIDTIPTILDSDMISDSYLESMAKKVGILDTGTYPDEIIRFMISAFPYIIKYKGSLRGIRYATQAFLKINGIEEVPLISIDNINYRISIGIESKIIDITLLKTILEYIIPTGYFISIYFYAGKNPKLPDSYYYNQVNDYYKSNGNANDFMIIRDAELSYNENDKILDGRNQTLNTVGMTYVAPQPEEVNNG